LKEYIIQRTIENLERNGFVVNYFTNSEAAKVAILEELNSNETVGFGGSVTVDELGLYESLKEQGNPVYWHWHLTEGMSRKELLDKAATADIYISSTNAITENGSLINIDGTGNRLSSYLYGHKKLFLVAGVNKIARNYEEAIIRIKNVACPANAKRLNRKTPCAELGKCMNCSSPDRFCMVTLVIDRQPGGVPISIFLIDENLGY
jgi:L-lactate utilization protein LutB